jgi:hypothetical protein
VNQRLPGNSGQELKASGGFSFPDIAEKAEASALKTFVGPKFNASVFASLCTEDAAMITGQDIHVRGGAFMY